MDTIFKEGQNVKDKVFRRGKRGIVRFVSKNKFRYYVLVDFENSVSALYTFDGILIDIDGNFIDSNPTLSIDNTTYVSKEDFNKTLTVDDAIKYLERKNDLYIVDLSDTCDFEEVYTSKEMYDAFEALKSLIFLRDYYNDGWIANWKDKDEIKYHIEIFNDNFIIENCFMHNRVMSFKTRKIAEKFLEEQIKLLEIAKPLL